MLVNIYQEIKNCELRIISDLKYINTLYENIIPFLIELSTLKL